MPSSSNTHKHKKKPRAVHTLCAEEVCGTVLVIDEQYPITLGREVALETLLREGWYDSMLVDECEIKQVFERDPRTEYVTLVPICIEKSCPFEEMLEEIASAGYRSATFRELLGLGAQYPELQRRKVLVALGSSGRETYIQTGRKGWKLDTVIRVPILADVLGERMLIFGEFDGKHRPGFYFMCVKL